MAGTYPDQLGVFREMVDRGDLNIRVNAMIQNPRKGDLEAHFREHRVVNYGGRDMFQVRSVKVFFDGALGSRGAAFYEPYTDDPGNIGVTEIPPEHLYEVALAGLKAGVQIAPHAIGIRGNGVMLDMFGTALGAHFLIEQARLANGKLGEILVARGIGDVAGRRKLFADNADAAFYHNKVQAAVHFCYRALPMVSAQAVAIRAGEKAAMAAVL